MRRATVALVGAGPGDPGLLTVRGRRLLRRADVVVYDRLVDRRLLALVPDGAVRVFAGKAKSRHAFDQDHINDALIRYAQRGCRVVRLKGGDPFVFGRGGEEAEALAAAGIAFEIVPGVTSAVAVPAYAGIPVTHRRLASSFAVVTGHEADRPGSRVNWARLATAVDTLVILMGLTTLTRLARELIVAGRAPSTPVAVVRAGTTYEQRVVTGTLSDIAGKVSAAKLESPVVIIVGEVVHLHELLAGFNRTSPLRRRRRHHRMRAASAQ